ncbi:hypothetical protein [Vulcanisaeta sp. JCM 16161]
MEHAKQVVTKYFREALIGRRTGAEDMINKNIKAKQNLGEFY